MHLLCAGDSWCYGSDLGRNHEHKDICRYSTLLHQKLNSKHITNIAKPGIANSHIIFLLTEWLALNGYISGENDRSKLFVSIGWTSPERFEIYPHKTILNRKDPDPYWQTLGPWIFNMSGENYPINSEFKDLIEWFYLNCKSEYSDYHIWVTQVYTIQNLLENLGIKFLMHQAIYQNEHYRKLEDKINHQPGSTTHIMWENVKEKNFLFKNDKNTSLYSYLLENSGDEKVFNDVGDHPNRRGHEIICELLYKHIKENKLWIS